MRYLKLHDVCASLQVSDDLLNELITEGLIEVKHSLDNELVISADDAERLRVSTLLVREMEVNLPGVEIILHMRDEILAAQRQFQEVLELIAAEIRKRFG